MHARLFVGFVVAVSLLGQALSAAAELDLGNSFTYQGQLLRDGAPANGQYSFEFALYDAADNGSLVGNPNTQTLDLNVSNGLFTTALNFGPDVFLGTERYLQISVRPANDVGPYTPLVPRQRLSPSPYALYALQAGNASHGSFNYATSTAPGGPATNLSCNGCVDSNEVANSSISSSKIADGTIQPSDLGFVPGQGMYWSLGGDMNTGANNFLGTTDQVPLNLGVGGERAFRLEPASSPNVIGGIAANSVTAGTKGATIGGGGDSNLPVAPNRVTDHFGTVGGGRGNQAGNGDADPTAEFDATVGGGSNNSASGRASTIGGGFGNQASGSRSTIAGGVDNEATAIQATVGGGSNNFAQADSATVAGGFDNAAQGRYSAVPGGRGNVAAGDYSFAAGRRANAAAGHAGAFVWADSTDADFTSTAADQFSIRASNGLRLASDAGTGKAIRIGERYRDNGIVAWAKVRSDGTLQQELGIASATRTAIGQYLIGIDATAASAASLVPIAVAELDAAPNAAADLRIVSVNQRDTQTFDVYVNRGTGLLVDNDFVFMVTAR